MKVTVHNTQNINRITELALKKLPPRLAYDFIDSIWNTTTTSPCLVSIPRISPEELLEELKQASKELKKERRNWEARLEELHPMSAGDWKPNA